MRPPTTIILGPADAARSIAIAWTNRAAFRVDSLRPRPTLEGLREGPGLHFLVSYLWAMLADERDRARYSRPEDLAELMPDPDQIDRLRALWKIVWLHAFDLDVDAPPQPTPPPAAETPAQEDDPQKSTGTKP